MQVFSCEFCEICKNTFFAEHDLVTASDYSSVNGREGKIGKRNCKLWTKIKAYLPIRARSVSYIKKGRPGQMWTGLRNSLSQMFFKIGVLKKFANSTEKHLCRRHFYLTDWTGKLRVILLFALIHEINFARSL